MMDHISVGVSDLERSARLRRHARRPRAHAPGHTAAHIGFGKTYLEFWINLRDARPPVPPESGMHICLRTKTTGEVDAFHAAALATGGASDGAPGIRPHDRLPYYAASDVDSDGSRIEAVTFPAE